MADATAARFQQIPSTTVEHAEYLPRPKRDAVSPEASPLFLLAAGLLPGLYLLVRYGGLWAENDTAQITLAARAIASAGSLVPAEGGAYPHGYLYPVLLHVLASFTGASLAELQQLYMPLVSTLAVLPAYILYRLILKDYRLSTLSTLLLITQSEFMFVLLRGSHERVSRSLMILALWLLSDSLIKRRSPYMQAMFTVCFYILGFALIATNAFVAISFYFAIFLAFLLSLVINLYNKNLADAHFTVASKLFWVVISLLVIGYISIYHAYEPHSMSVEIARSIWLQILVVFSGLEPVSRPYDYIAVGWRNIPSYALLSMSNFFFIALSIIGWLSQARVIVWNTGKQLPVGMWLICLLWISFVVQGLVGAGLDLAGILGSNLQLRIFPGVVVVGVPLAVLALVRIAAGSRRRLVVVLVIGLVTGLSMLKATLEPALSLNWLAYERAEVGAIRWSIDRLEAGSIWVGADSRLADAYAIEVGRPKPSVVLDSFTIKEYNRLFVISDLSRWQTVARGSAPPSREYSNRIYDNGSVQVFRLVPITAYQR